MIQPFHQKFSLSYRLCQLVLSTLLSLILLTPSQAATVNLLNSQKATASGTGSAGMPTLTGFNIPAGSNRVVYVTVAFERDQCDKSTDNCTASGTSATLSDNEASETNLVNAGDIQTTLRAAGVGGTITRRNPLTLTGTPPGDLRFSGLGIYAGGSSPSATVFELEMYNFSLMESDLKILLGGSTSGTIDLSFPNVALPKAAGDDAILMAFVFENVDQSTSGIVRSGAKAINPTSPWSIPGNFSINISAFDAGQAPNDAGDGLLAMGMSSMGLPTSNSGFNTMSGYTVLQTAVTNNPNGNYGNFSGNTVAEPDGMSMSAQFRNGIVSSATIQSSGLSSQDAIGGNLALFTISMFKGDVSDAPASYGNAFHLVTGPRLGASVDAESDPLASSNALGDDTNGTDDEDGMTLPATFSPGASMAISANVQSAAGYLNGWIDWNDDGDFLDAGEYVLQDLSIATGTTALGGTTPLGAKVGSTFARFRLCSTANQCNTPTGSATTGEVEDYAVTVANLPPVITSNGGGATASISIPENTIAVTTVTATDPNSDTVTFSLTGGADSAKFNLNSTTGVLTFKTAPDFEAPTDSGANNVYDVQVTASDGNGGTDVQAIAVTVTDVVENLPPVITSNGGGATASVSVPENQTAVTTVTATDPNVGDVVSFSITGGADAAKFNLNSTTGVLTFITAPDFEAPTDVGLNNVYDVQVTASDGKGGTDVQAIAITVTDVFENLPPVITSNGGGASAAISVAENQTAVTTVTATDPNVGDVVSFSLTGGADAAKFNLNSTTGVLTFKTAPDFEVPTDGGLNNVYDVQVTASDGKGGTDVQAIAVTVTDVFENLPPVITSNGGGATAAVSVPENTTAVTTVTATDPNVGDVVTFSLTGGADSAKFNLNSTTGVLTFKTAPDFEVPTDVGLNNVYDVQVTASDGKGGTDVQAIAVTVTDVFENLPPVITSNGGGASAAISVAENQTAVTTVTATDPNVGDVVSFSMTGGADSGKFNLNSTTGVLTFKTAPDFEVPTDAGLNNIYDVQVTASDLYGGVDVQAIAVTVTDVFENLPPVITSNGGGATAAVSVAENQTAVTTVTATDPNVGDVVSFSITGGADAAKFNLNSITGVLTFKIAPDFEIPTDAGSNNVYDVQVTASDLYGGTDVQAIAVTVMDVFENLPPVITSNGGGATAAVNVPENTTAVTTVTATDPNIGDVVSFSITGGSDAAQFTINSSTGVLTFLTAPNYEVPTDTDTNNVYDVQVTASDLYGGTDVQAITVTVTNVMEYVSVKVRGFLQGTYSNSTQLMYDTLRSKGLLPTSQPYSPASLGGYTGSDTVSGTRLAVNDATAVVDWVLIELRSTTLASSVKGQRAALLLRNGDVVDSATNSTTILIGDVDPGSYYVVLRHRNHLAVMSQQALSLSPSVTAVDFTLPSTATYGVMPRFILGNVAVMWAGDANMSQNVIANGPANDTGTILGSILMADANAGQNSNYIMPGYRNSDLDLNGVSIFAGPGNDLNILVGDVLLHPINSTRSANFLINGGVSK